MSTYEFLLFAHILFVAAWVGTDIAGFAFSFVAGAAFLGPETGRISRLAAERGAEDANGFCSRLVAFRDGGADASRV